MSRLATLVVAGSLIGLGGSVVGAPAGRAEPPPPPPVIVSPTTVPVAPGTTVPTGAAPTTTPAVTPTTAAVPVRVGSGEVSVVKDEGETWSVRRIATTVSLTVVGLAAIGFVYGRVRSSARRSTSSALVPTSE